MTVDVSGFRTLGDPRHVAAHAFPKGVNGVDSGLIVTGPFMTGEALFVAA